MSAEPDLDRTAVLQGVCGAYGLTLDTLAFIADGTAPAYRAQGPSGRYFVKVVPKTAYGAAMWARVTAEAPLLRALRQHGILPHVPRPRSTRDGADLALVEGHGLLCYEWIEATSLGPHWTKALPELAGLLGRLHAGSLTIRDTLARLPVSPEDFDLPFETALLENVRHLQSLKRAGRAGVRALQTLLLPCADDLERRLSQARSFQRGARARAHTYVVCHTDAHGSNVMRDGAGHLWLIDWETARLAPREHDLWMLHAALPGVLPAYQAALGHSVRLDLDVLGFYFYRRVLEDLAVDVNMILHEHTRPEQDVATLGILERYVLPSLQRVEDDFSRLSEALGHPGP